MLLPLRDTTFEIDNKFITNRPDLFSVVGNAREWSVIFNCPYTDPLSNISPMPQHLSTVGIHTSACLAYSLVEMQCDVAVGPSPFGIRVMMEKAGLKPKLNIVDITNLIMTEYGQPMHAFDADKIVGAISVRMAQDGEELHALNDVRYTLTSQDIVIADERGPIALAGVIGGMDSAVSASTKRIFWESATFDAATVRLTAQRHAIRTDASTRYEKSLDPTLAQKVFGRVEEYLRFCALPYTILSVSHYIQKD